MKFRNILVIPPCNTYGDCLSTIGMLYFLLKFYENVYLVYFLEDQLKK